MKENTKISLLGVIIFSIGYTYANVKYPLIIRHILDSMETNNIIPWQSFAFLALMILLLVGCNYVRHILKVLYLNTIKHRYRTNILKNIFKVNSDSLSSEKEAEYTSIFNNDISLVTKDYNETILNICNSVITIFFSITAIVQIHSMFAIVSLLAFTFIALVPRVFRGFLQNQKQNISDTMKYFNIMLKDNLFCLPVFKMYGVTDRLNGKVFDASLNTNEATMIYEKTQAKANLATMLIGYSNDFVIVLLGVIHIFEGKLTIGSLLAIIQITSLLANPITTLSYHINTLQSILPVKKKLEELSKPKTIKSVLTISDKMMNLQTKNISYQKDEKQILSNVNISFERGKKYLLVGKNGCGKSTLLKILNQNLLDYTGDIQYNHKVLDYGCIRPNTTMVYQEPYLFTATIMENITLGKKVDEHDFSKISSLLGIEQLVLDPDESKVYHLSSGEKQKIAIARALVCKPEILLLDEAYSAIDTKTREKIEAYLLDQSFTMINIAHIFNKDLLIRYDEIIVMDEGKILEHIHFDKLSNAVASSLFPN